MADMDAHTETQGGYEALNSSSFRWPGETIMYRSCGMNVSNRLGAATDA